MLAMLDTGWSDHPDHRDHHVDNAWSDHLDHPDHRVDNAWHRLVSVTLTTSTSPSVFSSTWRASKDDHHQRQHQDHHRQYHHDHHRHDDHDHIINQQRLCSGTITMRCTPRRWTHTQWLPRIGCSTTPANWRWWLLMVVVEVRLQTWRKQKGLLDAPHL